jgi:nitrogen regulatory protein PII
VEAVKRIEIITNSLELQEVLKVLSKAGISGYSIIKDI